MRNKRETIQWHTVVKIKDGDRMSYTPGPWIIDHQRIGPPGEPVALLCDVAAPYAATVVDWPRATDAEATDDTENEANARLIASAPDILAALKDVAEQIAAYDYLHGENSCAIDDAPALAAIRDLYPCYDSTSNIYPATKTTGRGVTA
jgi:hypothetical protein